MTTEARTDRSQILREELERLEAPFLSLYVPKPLIQTGGEKWRLLQKNAVSALEERGDRGEALANAIGDIELSDFAGHGIGLFAAGGETRVLQLKRRPFAMMDEGPLPFLLPALADAARTSGEWVLTIDKEAPKLFYWFAGDLVDRSDRLDAPDYAEIERRRAVQDDVFFHASAAGRVGGHHGPSMFHALGTAVGAEREKTDNAYFLRVAKALSNALPPQTDHLTIMGDPRTAGHFKEHLERLSVSVDIIDAAGDAHEPTQIAQRLAERPAAPADLPEGELERDPDTIAKAAGRGRVATMVVAEDHAMLEDKIGEDSEHLSFRDLPETARKANAIVLPALKHGAALQWIKGTIAPPGGLGAIMRWDRSDAA